LFPPRPKTGNKKPATFELGLRQRLGRYAANKVFNEYFGYVPRHAGNYEIDHLISLKLGGCNSIDNLWPLSYSTTPWNSHVKDKLEDRMAALLRECLKTKGHDAASELMRQFRDSK
jgi:hypothetical protein